ncbi:MAG: ferrous iron transport protein B [Chloroflexi bacterium]|nr:ferrous iron transport protein B [Chloroflexota bacterium]
MTCHTPANAALGGGLIALVGHSNVGKSALFQKLTGQRVIVANYPGTTVALARGRLLATPGVALVDTPGVVTLPARSEDERITARVLLDEPLDAVVQVGDAKNLPKTLNLTLQLAELGLPLVLALNMVDEAGPGIDSEGLAGLLGVPVILTAAVHGQGLAQLGAALPQACPSSRRLPYPPAIESALAEMIPLLPSGQTSKRGLALLYLCGDSEVEGWLSRRRAPEALENLNSIRRRAQAALLPQPLAEAVQAARWQAAEVLAAQVHGPAATRPPFRSRLAQWTIHPFWGLPILLAVLVALFWFVGVVGAQWLVGLLETNLFGEVINPALTAFVRRTIPLEWLADLLVGEYGLWTLGVTYAAALILPIVTTFFLAFGLLEDSGYLPRLAALSNRWFRALGLNGRAILPMVLGLGCVTMATLTTRTLETRRERFLVTLLLALAVPCSAQLGVVMGLLASVSPAAAALWAGVVLMVLFAVGALAARLAPGERQPLVLELPPLRWPLLANIVVKTLARLEWYLREVVPMFLLGALLMFLLDRSGALAGLVRLAEPLTVGWLGLPAAAAPAFVLGFLRRDFGAAGFFILSAAGLLSPAQTVVAMVTITLFIPCIASVLVIAREHGWRVALGMFVLIFPLAFLVGGMLQRLLAFIGFGA